jgi:hypothetical protein
MIVFRVGAPAVPDLHPACGLAGVAWPFVGGQGCGVAWNALQPLDEVRPFRIADVLCVCGPEIGSTSPFRTVPDLGAPAVTEMIVSPSMSIRTPSAIPSGKDACSHQ